jgi:hypothetical protein
MKQSESRDDFMYQVKEKDWKLFRKMLPEWQDKYMERLTKEYIELLSSDRQASDKFWALDKRIKDDKKCTGVIARDIRRSHMFQHIIDLMYEGAITEDDLKEFSEDLRNTIKTRPEIDRRYFGS